MTNICLVVVLSSLTLLLVKFRFDDVVTKTEEYN